MTEKEDAVVLISALVGQAMALVAGCRNDGDKQKYTLTELSFDSALSDPLCEGWFTKRLRCSRASFLAICRFLQVRGVGFYHAVVKKHSYEKKAAAALYFIASVGGYRETADAMGMTKSYVIDIVDEVVRVLCDAADDVICFPHDRRGWEAVESHFANRCNYPGVVGAVDGSLLAIQRPKEFNGFYCRKGYPALNMQAIVTANLRFMSIELRPGSWSDKKSWKYSYIGQHAHGIIPAGTHFIGDAGYALLPSLIVPYAEREEGGSLTSKPLLPSAKAALLWGFRCLCVRRAYLGRSRRERGMQEFNHVRRLRSKVVCGRRKPLPARIVPRHGESLEVGHLLKLFS